MWWTCSPSSVLKLRSAIVALALLGLAGCGAGSSDGPSARQLALERSQFVQVTAGLQAAQGAIRNEVAASRGAWPSIVSGLPATSSPALRSAVAKASTKAALIPAPPFLAEPRSLTGPAAGIAGLYESYERLAPRSWQLVLAAVDAIATGPPSAARYSRTNSSFYIDAIYDAHFNLSLVGKSLTAGYEKLGGAGAFGARLTASRLAVLAAAYSIPAVRLEPHPAGAAKEG
ncbi:MAG: hypothetical protein WBV85_05110 [Solirubrobacteraceae bacterium]